MDHRDNAQRLAQQATQGLIGRSISPGDEYATFGALTGAFVSALLYIGDGLLEVAGAIRSNG
jgi:hypothetical protein